MNQKEKKFYESKNGGTKRAYRRAFELFHEFTEKERAEKLTGEDLIKIVAGDRRKKIEEREKPEVDILKNFYKWLASEAKNGEGYSSKTSHVYLSAITAFLNHHDLPVSKEKLSLPKATRKENNRKLNIRRDQVRKLVNHAKTNRDKAVILCLWQSGMSISDLLNLDVSDVMVEDPVRGSLDDAPLLLKLSRKKSGVDYRTLFGQDACEMLKRYLEERKRTIGGYERSDPLFLQQRKRNGEGYKRLTRSAVEMMFRRLAKKSGLVSEEKLEEADFNPARPHALRAGFSSVLKEEGVNQSIIDGLTGHSVAYGSAYHNFTDKQLRDLYKENEDVLSIEQVSIPRESEIEQAVRKHFGESGVERVMPEVKDKLEEQEERISELERELERKRGFSEMVVEKIDEMDIEGSLDELIEKAVEERVKEEMEKVREGTLGEKESA